MGRRTLYIKSTARENLHHPLAAYHITKCTACAHVTCRRQTQGTDLRARCSADGLEAPIDVSFIIPSTSIQAHTMNVLDNVAVAPQRVWLGAFQSLMRSALNNHHDLPVTEASSSLGLATAEAALSKGDVVVDTQRRPEVLTSLVERYNPGSQLYVLTVDLTKPSHVVDALAYVKANVGSLGVVFNNAGGGFVCEVEGTPEDAVRALFKLNFWGSLRVSREAIKSL
jgi:hypothetical protein